MSGTNGAMKGLSRETIAGLMAGGRSRNAYGPKLIEFVDSDEPAIDVKEVWSMEFSAKESSTLYQGFMLAVKKAELSDVVRVKQSDGNVFLMHNERVAILLAP